MIREGHENVKFFYGTEVEHTPAYGKYTLFVVGIQSLADIALALSGGSQLVEHIYFGANMSFPKLDLNDAKGWREWEEMIYPFLEKGNLCTLDVDSSCVEGLTESILVESHNFIPMISVKLPYLQLLGYNATIKLDDKDFNATNPGVWCHSLHNLTDRSVFTDWSKYTKDEVSK
jgi:hypothetical protein